MSSCIVRFQYFESQVSQQPVILKITGTFYNWSVFEREREIQAYAITFDLGQYFPAQKGEYSTLPLSKL